MHILSNLLGCLGEARYNFICRGLDQLHPSHQSFSKSQQVKRMIGNESVLDDCCMLSTVLPRGLFCLYSISDYPSFTDEQTEA